LNQPFGFAFQTNDIVEESPWQNSIRDETLGLNPNKSNIIGTLFFALSDADISNPITFVWHNNA
jgi:hypothetical protein